MLFFSQIYLFLFLPLVLVVIYNHKFLNIDYKIALILFSLFFYSWWNVFYLPLILVSIITNFYFCKKIFLSENKKYYLFYGISFNILILIIFKYSDFIITNFNNIFGTTFQLLNIPFPLAISFITFQIITFFINCYDKEIKEIKFKDFFLFVIFFPQLIAGPIVKFAFMNPQFEKIFNIKFNNINFLLGIVILLIGLIKKLIFADTLSIFVDYGFDNTDKLTFISSWILSLSFTFQLYFDFSGYVDMATGSALMLNIYLPRNFNSPYKSLSIIDFWRRWHITLSDFLTNYIYSPWLKSLKKITFYKSMILVIVVFLIAGLWHGASWCFVLFGLTHGLGLVINHSFRKLINYKINRFVSWFLTFNFINFSFIFFRSNNIDQFYNVIKNMVSLNLSDINILNHQYIDFKFILVFSLSFVICLFFKNTYFLIEQYRKNN